MVSDLECIVSSVCSWISSQSGLLEFLLECVAVGFFQAPLQLGIFMAVLKKLKTGQTHSVSSELGPGKNLASGRKSSIQLSLLHIQSSQGSVLAILLPNASLETLGEVKWILVFFGLVVFFFSGVLFECWETEILIKQLFFFKWLTLPKDLKVLLDKSYLESFCLREHEVIGIQFLRQITC